MASKGWIDVLFLTILVVFSFAIISIFIGNTYNNITNSIIDTGVLSEDNTERLEESNNNYPMIIDGAFAFLLAVFYILCLYVSYNSLQEPLFKIIGIVFIVLMVVASILLGSFYDDLSDDSSLSSFRDYNLIHWVLSNFAIVTVVYGFSMIAMMSLGGRNT